MTFVFVFCFLFTHIYIYIIFSPDPVESMFLTSGSSILDNSERRQSGLRYTYSSSSVTVKHIPKTPITASAKQPKPTIASLSTSLTASSSLESAHNHHHHRHHHHHHHNHNHNHGDNSNSSNNSSGHNSKLATPLAATAESPTHRNLQKDPLDDVPQTRPRVRSSAPRPKHQSIILSPTIGPVNPAKASSSSSLKPKGSDHESSPPPLPKYPQGLSSPQPIADNKSGSAVHLPSLLGSMSVNCDEKAYDIDEDDDEFDVVDLAK